MEQNLDFHFKTFLANIRIMFKLLSKITRLTKMLLRYLLIVKLIVET